MMIMNGTSASGVYVWAEPCAQLPGRTLCLHRWCMVCV